MIKTTSGSFIIWCEPFSTCGDRLNSDEPTYKGKPVCILQVEPVHVAQDRLIVFELIYKE